MQHAQGRDRCDLPPVPRTGHRLGLGPLRGEQLSPEFDQLLERDPPRPGARQHAECRTRQRSVGLQSAAVGAYEPFSDASAERPAGFASLRSGGHEEAAHSPRCPSDVERGAVADEQGRSQPSAAEEVEVLLADDPVRRHLR